jgi:hypothetical protein
MRLSDRNLHLENVSRVAAALRALYDESHTTVRGLDPSWQFMPSSLFFSYAKVAELADALDLGCGLASASLQATKNTMKPAPVLSFNPLGFLTVVDMNLLDFTVDSPQNPPTFRKGNHQDADHGYVFVQEQDGPCFGYGSRM